MSDFCVVVADGARARFFTLEAPEVPDVEPGPTLVEREALANAEAQMLGRDKYSDMKSGRNKSAMGVTHGYDDHRDKHDAENERRFATKIAGEALQLATKSRARQLIVAADKTMLGMLRQAISGPSNGPLEIKEIAKNLTKLSPTELHQYLAGEKLLPARKQGLR